jgi:UDP-N-acetylmuramate--alanine ligase
MIGIGGSGMSSLAKVLLEMGKEVSGCDLRANAAIGQLQEAGARIYLEHNPDHLQGAEVVIYSTAVARGNPELIAARQKGIPLLHRSQALASLLNRRQGIAVAGTHGKTTVTAMVSLLLERGGLDPTILIGGDFPALGGGAKYGAGPYLVAEADESDASFLHYHPQIAVITGVEPDHLEFYGDSREEHFQAYRNFAGNLRPGGHLVLGWDDPGNHRLTEGLGHRRVITYGLHPQAHWQLKDFSLGPGTAQGKVWRRGELLGRLELRVPGRYNLVNGLGALAVAVELCGLSYRDAAGYLGEFSGVDRRFQLVGDVHNILLFDDYAHHPTEVAATLQAAKEGWQRRVVAIFQPHRYSRTKSFWEDFGPALALADVIIITPIYSPALDKPLPGVTGKNLADYISRQMGRMIHYEPELVASNFLSYLRPGDLVLTLGAGNIRQLALDLVDLLAAPGEEADGR